jgi:nitroreductase
VHRFFQLILDNPISVAITIAALSLALTYLIAFFQKRAVSFWPPRIEGKPTTFQRDEKSSMSVTEAIRTRRSVRAFLNKPVEDEKLNRILEAGRLSPSASNRQERRFVIIRKRETIKKLTAVAVRQAFVGKAQVLVVACADTDEHVMKCGQLSYPIDVAIALDHMTLAAVEQGLGTCWIGRFDENKTKAILDIPERIRVVGLLALGYPTDASAVEKKRLPLDRIVKFEHW